MIILKLILFVIIALCFFYFMLSIFQAYLTRRLRKKYNPEEDLSRRKDETKNS